MPTGENEHAMRKILDMTRMISIGLLILHFYVTCYRPALRLHLTSPITDRLLDNISKTGVFHHFNMLKFIALAFLWIALLGAKGKKEAHYRYAHGLLPMLAGLLLYFGSYYILLLPAPMNHQAAGYITVTSLGYLAILLGGTRLSRIIRDQLQGDIFNAANETFPQEERLLENEYSVNLPACYQLGQIRRRSWINFINPFRGLLVIGSPGSGKSYFIIRHMITQHLKKGFSMFVYDFKYDDLSRIVYNTWLRQKDRQQHPAGFYVINFDQLDQSHRCNPLDPASMFDITDAAESARTILLGLNREWIKRQGDFFVESPINFLTAVIWYLKKYENGACCTLPHVIELMQLDYEKLFTILRTEPEIEVLINPFVSAFLHDAAEQLEGQIASAKIAMARLASPQLYYVLSGHDFTLDINNPAAPKIVCAGNNPQKIQIYGAVLSLYVNRLIKLINQKGKLKSSLIFDEFPTLYLNNIDTLIATARSNKVATCLAVQDLSQLRKDYGREQADVIMNITGNVISGQVTGDTARQLSERFGKIMQDRESLSINSTDTSMSKSKQLEFAIPAAKISGLSSGEFVGMVADDPQNKIKLKTFHCEIINDHEALRREDASFKDLPAFSKVKPEAVKGNYHRIKADVQELARAEMERLLATPELAHLIIRKR